MKMNSDGSLIDIHISYTPESNLSFDILYIYIYYLNRN